MANFSYTDHIGDGVTTTFPFSFVGQGKGYIRDSDIYVYVDGNEKLFVLSGDNQITFAVSPDTGSKIRIRRVMPKNEPFANFSRGNAFTQDLLNKSFLQTLYTYHEFLDGFLPEFPFFLKGDLDLGLNRITNLASGLLPNDAVTLRQVQDLAFNGYSGLSFHKVILPVDGTPEQNTSAVLSALLVYDYVLLPPAIYGPIDIVTPDKVILLDFGVSFKLTDGLSSTIETAAISTFKVSAANITLKGELVVNGNLLNNYSNNVSTSDRRGSVHIGAFGFRYDTIRILNSHWVGFSVGSNVDSGEATGGIVKVINPRSYSASLWDCVFNIHLIEVLAGADSLDARIRTGSQTSSPEKTSSGIIHSIQTNDTVVIEANSKKLSVSACIAKALKVEDSEDIGLPESMMLTGATTESFTFAVLSSKGVSWGTVNVRDHAGTNGVPAVRLSEVYESSGHKISVKGTITNVSDVDMRSAKDVTINTVECLEPVGTGRGFIFDYDALYIPQENIRIGNITSRGHTELDIEIQNYQNVDVEIGTINKDASTNNLELLTKNDYYDGIFNAALTTGGGSATLNSSFDVLSVNKSGRRVSIGGQIRLSAVSSPTGAVNITGIPFTASNEPEQAGVSIGVCHVSNFATYTGRILAQINEADNKIYLFRQDGNVTSDIGTLLQANSSITLQINYIAGN